MNIVVLDNDFEQCARHHCKQHVGKMILENAQLLCTALNQKVLAAPYRRVYLGEKSAFATWSKRDVPSGFGPENLTGVTSP